MDTLVRLGGSKLVLAAESEHIRWVPVVDKNGDDIGDVDEIVIDDQERSGAVPRGWVHEPRSDFKTSKSAESSGRRYWSTKAVDGLAGSRRAELAGALARSLPAPYGASHEQ
jgi:hypothetical protein